MDNPDRPATGGSFVMTKSGKFEEVEGPNAGYPAPVEEPVAPDVWDGRPPVLGGSYVETEDGMLVPVEGPALEAALEREALESARKEAESRESPSLTERFDAVEPDPKDPDELAVLAAASAVEAVDMPPADAKPPTEERKQ